MKNINCTSCGSNNVNEIDEISFTYQCDNCGTKFSQEGITLRAGNISGELIGIEAERLSVDARVSIKIGNVEKGAKVIGIRIGNL